MDPRFRAWLQNANEKLASWNHAARRLGVGGATG